MRKMKQEVGDKGENCSIQNLLEFKLLQSRYTCINPYTSINIALWIITVKDSTVDKEFLAYVIIGDGRIYGGVLLYFGDLLGESKLPLVYAEDCGSKYCYSSMLNSSPTATIVFK
ncbi:hypothetical protein LguiB_019319 [Lonicera macranthoides]